MDVSVQLQAISTLPLGYTECKVRWASVQVWGLSRREKKLFPLSEIEILIIQSTTTS